MTTRRVLLLWFAIPALYGLSHFGVVFVLATLVGSIGALGVYGMVRRLRDQASVTAPATASRLLDLAAVVTAVTTLLTLGVEDVRHSFTSASVLAAIMGACILAGALIVSLGQRMPDRALGLLFEAVLSVAALALFPWAIAANGDVPIQTILHFLPVAFDAVVLWLSVCLVRSSPGQRAEHRYLVSAVAMLIAADVVAAATEYGTLHDDLAIVRLFACCLLAVAALQPSVRLPVEPTVAFPSRLSLGAVAAPLVLTLLAPALFALQALSGTPPRLAVVLGGTSAVAFLVAVYLVRKVQEGAKNEYRAHHDPLTGLPHRAMFHDRLEVACRPVRREPVPRWVSCSSTSTASR